MSPPDLPPTRTLSDLLTDLLGHEEVQSNCMFQLSVMLASIALQPCSPAYKEATSQALLNLIRQKPRSNVINLFGPVAERVRESRAERDVTVVG
ncbi:MAG TPA: hypothetical protein VH414_06595 [Lichenihabitans sp.]|jgi:hypothetical protein|nr:hypothetical protein [Lichenihabitans sp.]